MNELYEVMADLSELQELYHIDELRDFDFDRMINKYRQRFEEFESYFED